MPVRLRSASTISNQKSRAPVSQLPASLLKALFNPLYQRLDPPTPGASELSLGATFLTFLPLHWGSPFCTLKLRNIQKPECKGVNVSLIFVIWAPGSAKLCQGLFFPRRKRCEAGLMAGNGMGKHRREIAAIPEVFSCFNICPGQTLALPPSGCIAHPPNHWPNRFWIHRAGPTSARSQCL